ncbi:hypothetical protein R3P38DRAFT_2828014 [Favolaschia claudopus]|uniref:Nitrogen regulatory protein areA GATA-like domain-containing protein n=1 Tax=Favolaschia claudopus TaxID=2862362 RepID=A0AAW0EA09_9AGAR
MGTNRGSLLTVSADALDSQDALHLWFVFSKCKNSLQDGPRLENISWRLTSRDSVQKACLPDRTCPPTPESLCSEDSGAIKYTDKPNTSSRAAATLSSSFFHISPRKPSPSVRPAGRIIAEMIPHALPKNLTELRLASKKTGLYPTPASSSSSDSSGSASSSRVSIAVEEAPSSRRDSPEVELPKIMVLTPTPNLTPHPTPPATPLLAPSTPPARVLAPPARILPASTEPSIQTRRDPPGPLFLPRSATRGMGSPVFSPVDAQAPQAAYAPQSTHILPLGGRSPGHHPNGHAQASKPNLRNTGSKFFLDPRAVSGRRSQSSSHSSETSTSYDNDGEELRSRSSGSSSSSNSSGEGGDPQTIFIHGTERGDARGRGQAKNAGRSSAEAEVDEKKKIPDSRQPPIQEPPRDLKKPPLQQPLPAAQPTQQQQPQSQTKLSRTATAPSLRSLGLGLEMTPRTETRVNGRPNVAPATSAAEVDDARSVSSRTTSSSQVRRRARGKQPSANAVRSQQSRSRSRKGRTSLAAQGKAGSGTQQFGALGLPSELAAATALVERTMGAGTGRKVVLQTSDEEDGDEDGEEDGEWTDSESAAIGSVGGEAEDTEQDDEEDWEDESEIMEAPRPAKAKAPSPALQERPPSQLGLSRVSSTGGIHANGNDPRPLPTHRSAGHLPSLAGGQAKHHHTTSAQNARTSRALKATMSATALSTVMLEAQRQRELFAKAPRSQSGVAEQYHQQQQQLQQQNGVPSLRARPGGFNGLGLQMSSARPPSAAGGAELSPIPPTPATAVQQPHPSRQPTAQVNVLPPIKQQPAPPPRRPGMARALSSSALPPHFGGSGSAGTSGSFGKSSVAQPVVSVGPNALVEGAAAPVASGSSAVQAGSTSAGRSGGYRPKGPPAETEFDDDDESDADARGKGKSRDEGQLSQSAAQEKLRVFLSRTKPNGTSGPNGVEGSESERRRLYEQAGVVPWAAAANQHNVAPDHVAQPPPNRSMSAAPVGFVYHLPAPAPPSTPRTTRQQMLRNEMSESLRHNLLWQRKLSRTDTVGPQPRRTKSTVNVPSAAMVSIQGLGGRQPEKNLVRVTPRPPEMEQPDPIPPVDSSPDGTKKKLVRNLSWANMSDYHERGW